MSFSRTQHSDASEAEVKHSSTEPLCSKNVVLKAGIHQMLVRMANREDLDQTASSDLGLISDHLLHINLFALFSGFCTQKLFKSQ